jgi:uncharacterized DUF497 family protein
MTRPLFEITCDPGKAKSNHAKHGVTVFDQTHSEVEDRWFTLGLSTNGRLLAVSHTHAFDVRIIRVRIISARLATRRERAQYEHKV